MITDTIDLSSLSAPVATETLPKRPLFEHDRDHDYILRIDNSTLEVFQTCPRAAKFYCVDRRESPSTAALLFGSAIHEGLAILHSAPRTKALVVSAAEATMEHMRKYYVPSADEWRTPQLAIETILAYCDYYPHDKLMAIEVEGKPYVEKPFSLHVGTMELDATLPFRECDVCASDDTTLPYIRNLHIMWSGRIDAAVSDDGNIFVMDHKTSSIGGSQFFEDFILSQQMNGYIWALRKLLPDYNIPGVIINAIIQRKPTRTGKQLEFIRDTKYQPEWMQNEWQQDMLSGVEQFIHSLLTAKFPKATKWCFGKYGKCKYHDVCTSPPNLRHAFLHGINYQNVTWSPLNDR